MVRTAHHRSSAGGNIEAISGTWMPSRSRTRITTRTRAPTRSCRSSGEEIDLGSPPAIRISCPIRARPRFVSVPCRSASSKTKSATENGGSEFERERDHREQAIGSLDGTDFDYGRAILSRAWADNIEREGPFFHRRPRNGRSLRLHAASLRAPASRRPFSSTVIGFSRPTVRSPTMIWSIGSTACVLSGVALVSAAWFCPEPMHCRDPPSPAAGFARLTIYLVASPRMPSADRIRRSLPPTLT